MGLLLERFALVFCKHLASNFLLRISCLSFFASDCFWFLASDFLASIFCLGFFLSDFLLSIPIFCFRFQHFRYFLFHFLASDFLFLFF
ncbi:unnamed protein product [Meloidogyne enterolobii]|uniref:Uncharacterized protein n=1 Tax=Meloidogyne enterolobii TaxID=390850 RepID=A0ACB0XK57_MELEN